MKFLFVAFGCAWLGLVGPVSAADIAVEETADDEGGLHRRSFGFSAQLGADEVLVVRSTRWEDGAKVLEIEEACAGPGWVITIAEPAPHRWQLGEAAAEQHLQGLQLARLEHSGAQLELELAPVAGGAKRHYAFRWRATVEKWSALQSNYPANSRLPCRRLVAPRLAAGTR